MKKIWLVSVAICALLASDVVQAQSVNSFMITQYDVAMSLGRDGENRSTLRTVETISAEFPETDQNHGLEKVFVREYDGHTTSLDLVSVTDAEGGQLPYHWQGDALRIGDKDSYVHGTQTYVITYTQRDVTKFFADTDRDEFYWDVIGVEWRVPIEKASVTVNLDRSLISAATDDASCYQGASGDTTRCEIVADNGVFSATATTIGDSRGMTVAIGFSKGTFSGYQMSLWERLTSLWGTLQLATTAGAVAVATWVIARWHNLTSRRKEIGTIVPEYLPPTDTSVTTAARLGSYIHAVMTAQLIDLAVRHYVKIYEVKEKSLFRAAEYDIEIVKDITDLKWEEKELLRDTFGEQPTAIGQRINLKTLKNNTAYFKRTLNNDSDLDKRIKGEYGLKEEDVTLKRWMRTIAKVVLLIAVVTVSPGLFFASGMIFLFSFAAERRTDKGLALVRYLKGLKTYIEVAEEERLKMLQSPEGAQKVAGVNASDTAQLIKLYERVLPYAVLFNQEKNWNKQIGSYYESSGTQPDWYVGRGGAFNTVAFASGMSGLQSASTSASSSSSSSGGSSGGGGSGGGGGGGGGGGW